MSALISIPSTIFATKCSSPSSLLYEHNAIPHPLLALALLFLPSTVAAEKLPVLVAAEKLPVLVAAD